MVVNAAARAHSQLDNPNYSVRFADIVGMVAILRRSIVLIPHVLASALRTDVRQQANAEPRTTDYQPPAATPHDRRRFWEGSINLAKQRSLRTSLTRTARREDAFYFKPTSRREGSPQLVWMCSARPPSEKAPCSKDLFPYAVGRQVHG
jgi:hypothetical protein